MEAQLNATKDETSLPPVGDLRKRIAREFDQLRGVMASGSLEERGELVACYVDRMTADPATQRVGIGLIPTALSKWWRGLEENLRPGRTQDALARAKARISR